MGWDRTSGSSIVWDGGWDEKEERSLQVRSARVEGDKPDERSSTQSRAALGWAGLVWSKLA